MSSGLDVLSGSLRVRNSSRIGSGLCKNFNCKISEVRSCPSVMSPETKRLLPPNTETVQTKPFPIRGKFFMIVFKGYVRLYIDTHEFKTIFCTIRTKSSLYIMKIKINCGLSTIK